MFTKVPIAHRGLHNAKEGRAENSAQAFEAAINNGYAIECDLQMCKDGVVVFHDSGVERLTQWEGKVIDYKLEELAGMKLGETRDCINTLEWHLIQVDAKVPVILEIKKAEGNTKRYIEQIAKELEKYKGEVAVMSFDVGIVTECKKMLENIPCGLVSDEKEENYEEVMKIMEEGKLDFLSYDVEKLPNKAVENMKKLGKPVLTWTVKDAKQAEQALKWVDQITFEGYMPDGY